MSSIFFLLDDECIINKDRIKNGVEDVAKAGFKGIWINIRNSNYNLSSPEVVESFNTAVEEAVRLGLKAYINVHLTEHDTGRFLQKYPAAYHEFLVKNEVKLQKGMFDVRILYPQSANSSFHGIERIFWTSQKNGTKLSGLRDVTQEVKYDVERESDIDLKGGTLLGMGEFIRIRGNYADDGFLIIFCKFRTGCVDYAADEFKLYTKSLLNLYKKIRVHGIWWDEPGYRPEGRWSLSCYVFSKTLRRKFYESNGYDLMDKLPCLDYEIEGEPIGKIRYDYYRCLRDAILESQMFCRRESQRIFGKSIEFGIHQTWMENTSMDLRIGAIDYFCLTEALSGGFTDAFFMMGEESMFYSLILARSLNEKIRGEGAYNNSWNFNPTEGQIDYMTRLMTILQVDWIAHAYGDTAAFGPGYPHHHTWGMMNRITHRLSAFEKFTNQATPSVNIALVHTWESLAHSHNDPYMHIHRYSAQKLTHSAFLGHHFLNLVSTGMVGTSRIKEGEMIIGNNHYDLLVVPWPLLLPGAAWEKIKEFARLGGKVVFYGLPLWESIEGENLTKEFAELIGIESIGPAQVKMAALEKMLLTYYFGKTNRAKKVRADIDRSHPFEISIRHFYGNEIELRYFALRPKHTKAVLTKGKEILGVQNKNIYFFSFDFPCFPKITQDLLNSLDVGESFRFKSRSKILYQTYKTGKEKMILITAREGLLRGSFIFEDKVVKMDGVKTMGVKLKGKGFLEMLVETEEGRLIRKVKRNRSYKIQRRISI